MVDDRITYDETDETAILATESDTEWIESDAIVVLRDWV
jgi:hypothetical protein